MMSDATPADRALLPVDYGPQQAGVIANRWALLVGINRYVDSAFASLKFCVNDVRALEQLLNQLDYTVICLHDELDRNDPRFPTYDNVEAELKRLCDAGGENDLLLVHFACHGTLINGQPVLITQDTRYTALGTKALPLAIVEAQMRQSQASRLVLMLDACHTGVEVGREIADPEFIRNAYDLAEGFALIAASTTQQVAQEWQAMEHGVFTYYLLDGLGGKADLGNKGFVTFKDLQTYVLSSLQRWNMQHSGLVQEPTARTEGLGDMILADYRKAPLSFPLSIPAISATSTSQLVSQKLLQNYVQALTVLESTSPPSPEQVLTVLRTRDQVQADLNNTDAADLITLKQYDRRLKAQTPLITKIIALADWRKTVQPSEVAWWWFLEPDPPYRWLKQSDWFWNALTISALTVSSGLVVNLWSYFFAAGLSTAGAGSIAFNSLLTLITGGSTLSQVKHQARDDLFNRFRFPQWSWQPLSSGATFVLMSLLIGVRTALPLMATHFKQSGEREYLADDLNTALVNYQQAIALRPGYADAHYELGLLFEELQKDDQAISEYQLAIQSSSSSENLLTLLRSNNNLGRLYLLKGDANKAFLHLEKTTNLVKADALKSNSDIKTDYYSVLKNMGWLRLLQKRYPEADAFLQQAIDLDAKQAAAYCLHAQVLEAQKQNQMALQVWNNCLRYANRSVPEEDQWIGMANSASERLDPKGTQP